MATRKVNTSLSDYYFIVSGKEDNFTYFDWKDATLSNNSKNLMAKDDKTYTVYKFNDKDVYKQNAVNTSIVAQKSVIITTTDSYKKNDKKLYKKKCFSFPRLPNILIISYALEKSLTLKDKILPFKGLLTYKIRGGGRFVIAKPPTSVLDASIRKYLDMLKEQREDRNKDDREPQSLED